MGTTAFARRTFALPERDEVDGLVVGFSQAGVGGFDDRDMVGGVVPRRFSAGLIPRWSAGVSAVRTFLRRRLEAGGMNTLFAAFGGFGFESLNATLASHPLFLAGLFVALVVAVWLGRRGDDDPDVPSREELLDLAERYED